MACNRGYFAQGCAAPHVLHVGGVTARRCCDLKTGGCMLQNGGVWSMTRRWRPYLFVILVHIGVRSLLYHPWIMLIMQVLPKHTLLYVSVKYQQYLQSFCARHKNDTGSNLVWTAARINFQMERGVRLSTEHLFKTSLPY